MNIACMGRTTVAPQVSLKTSQDENVCPGLYSKPCGEGLRGKKQTILASQPQVPHKTRRLTIVYEVPDNIHTTSMTEDLNRT